MNWHGQHLTGEREKVREGNLDVVTFEFAIGKKNKKAESKCSTSRLFWIKKKIKEIYFVFPLLIITN